MQALTVCTKGYMVSFLLHHSAGKNACLDLFSFSISDSETNGWIFMFVAHSGAPFVLTVAAGIVDSLTVTWIYSL